MNPKGWLIDPKNRWLLLFHADPTSLKRIPKIYIDQWSCSNSGTPLEFKNRRKIDIDPAKETWDELISNGWLTVSHKFGQAA